jgi:hypothetical protein
MGKAKVNYLLLILVTGGYEQKDLLAARLLCSSGLKDAFFLIKNHENPASKIAAIII